MITRKDYEVPNLVPVLLEDKSNLCDFYRADVIAGKSFVQNDGGYPMNDVDLIIRQKDAQVQESLLAKLQEVPTTGVPADTDNAEVLLSLKSRYQQTPSEMVKFYEHQLEIAQSRAEVEALARENPDKIQFGPDDNPES